MKFCKFLTFFAMMFLTGCGTLEFGIERSHPATATVNSPLVETPTLTTPAVLSSPTAVILALTETIPAPTAIQAAPTSTSGPQMVKITLIGIGDNGQSGPLIGCGDSAIPVQAQIEPTQGVLRAALEKLLSIKDQFYGQSGLYDALYQSNLQVESVTITNGKANVQLTGTMQLAGECDNPRVQAQLEDTVLQFPTVTSADIFINGKTLAEALSLK